MESLNSGQCIIYLFGYNEKCPDSRIPAMRAHLQLVMNPNWALLMLRAISFILQPFLNVYINIPCLFFAVLKYKNKSGLGNLHWRVTIEWVHGKYFILSWIDGGIVKILSIYMYLVFIYTYTQRQL